MCSIDPGVWINDEEVGFNVLRLPCENLPPDAALKKVALNGGLTLEILCAALQNGCSVEAIKHYLESALRASVQLDLSSPGKSGLAILYAAGREQDGAKLVSLLLEYGADRDTKWTALNIPALAFIILYGHQIAVNTIDTVKTLLGHGVDPKVIPEDMWKRYLELPVPKADQQWDSTADSASAWCGPRCRRYLAPALHLTHRYLLYRASGVPKNNERIRQITQAHKMTSLFKIPYHLIGQSAPTNMVIKHVSAHVTGLKKEPLVMAFAGPSGHGKTEMAKQMGGLLSVPITVIDCTQFKGEMELFGPRAGYIRCEEGSQLNNFLGDHSGVRSVVFLDEFDKTCQEVRQALLLLCDSGDYYDRRNNEYVDCSKTIWVLATNLGDKTIMSYYGDHIERMKEEERDKVELVPLQLKLRARFRQAFGAPFTGRVNLFVPFLPFSKSEQAVVAHKFILQLADAIRKPIDISPEAKRFVGHSQLSLLNDSAVCRTIAENSYDRELGARSLYHAVNNLERDLYDQYTSLDEPVTEETNNGPLQKFTVKVIMVDEGMEDVTVVWDEPAKKTRPANGLARRNTRSLLGGHESAGSLEDANKDK